MNGCKLDCLEFHGLCFSTGLRENKMNVLKLSYGFHGHFQSRLKVVKDLMRCSGRKNTSFTLLFPVYYFIDGKGTWERLKDMKSLKYDPTVMSGGNGIRKGNQFNNSLFYENLQICVGLLRPNAMD